MTESEKRKLLQREVVYKGRILVLEVDKIQVGGIETIREIVRHPGGVVVLAEVEDDLIPFVRQHRYPVGSSLLELPAGRIDIGEDPGMSAARELEEETGFQARSLQHISSFYSSPGYCDELLHFYYTNNVCRTAVNHEHDEEISIEFYSLGEAMALALQGKILDGKTIAALFWLHHHRTQD